MHKNHFPLCTKYELIRQRASGPVVSSSALAGLLKHDYGKYVHHLDLMNSGGFTPESVEAVLRDWEKKRT